MRIVFMGTPEFAVPSLKELNDAFEVPLVVTRPDAVRGRGKRLEPSPVKACAEELCIDVVEANRITDEREKAIAYHDTVLPHMEIIRDNIDELELLVDDEMWPLPKYRELLFIR